MPHNGHLEWTATYKPGYVKAVGYKNGRKVMEERIETTGKPVMAETSYETVGDITIATIRMVDEKGRFVPTANEKVDFNTDGSWRILGWGNGDPAFQHIERPVVYGPSASGTDSTPVPDSEARTIEITTFNGLAQVILGKN
jgi:beta-galactosidase